MVITINKPQDLFYCYNNNKDLRQSLIASLVMGARNCPKIRKSNIKKYLEILFPNLNIDVINDDSFDILILYLKFYDNLQRVEGPLEIFVEFKSIDKIMVRNHYLNKGNKFYTNRIAFVKNGFIEYSNKNLEYRILEDKIDLFLQNYGNILLNLNREGDNAYEAVEENTK